MYRSSLYSKDSDKGVDVYLKKVVKATTKHVMENPTTVTGGMEYVMVAGYLERIVYITTGKIVELN